VRPGTAADEGYAATAGDTLIRQELCADAIQLGRMLASLMPDEPDVYALLALMLLHDSRRPARVGEVGDLVWLDRARPLALGSSPDRRGREPAGSVDSTEKSRTGKLVSAAGRHRFIARAECHARSDRLDGDRPALRGAHPGSGYAGGASQSRSGGGHGAGAPEAGLDLLERLSLDDYYLFHAARAVAPPTRRARCSRGRLSPGPDPVHEHSRLPVSGSPPGRSDCQPPRLATLSGTQLPTRLTASSPANWRASPSLPIAPDDVRYTARAEQ
jgi:hypothetical protein